MIFEHIIQVITFLINWHWNELKYFQFQLALWTNKMRGTYKSQSLDIWKIHETLFTFLPIQYEFIIRIEYLDGRIWFYNKNWSHWKVLKRRAREYARMYLCRFYMSFLYFYTRVYILKSSLKIFLCKSTIYVGVPVFV